MRPSWLSMGGPLRRPGRVRLLRLRALAEAWAGGEHAALGLDAEAGPRIRIVGLADHRATQRSALGRVVVLDLLRRASGDERDGSEGPAHERDAAHEASQTFLKR